ncbi:MAG: bifunctional pyr operon transcriptional regulator/uracil phosphoribosyltransferase, partial [candidate division WOR-3 bacterium]
MRRRLLTAEDIKATISRLSEEVAARNQDIDNLALIGIQRRGVPLAQRIARELGKGSVPVPVGS